MPPAVIKIMPIGWNWKPDSATSFCYDGSKSAKSEAMMDLRKIRYFLSIAETLNFSASARFFGISQPALTKAIRKLEEESGGPLLRREGRHTHLTQLGQMMLEHFLSVDAAARKAQSALAQFARRNGQQIRIAVMCTVGPQRLLPFLRHIHETMPHVETILTDATQDSIFQMLLSGAVDCAIVSAPAHDQDRIRLTPLFSEDMVLACAQGHPITKNKAASFEDVMLHPYLDRLSCEFRTGFLTECEARGFDVMFAGRSEREDWIQSMVAAGLGVTIMGQSSVALEGIVTLPFAGGKFTRTIQFADARGRADTPLLRSFFTAVQGFNWAAAAQP
jgi:LysR family hydrogen peroxide-inducible transcriptional activator